ncbi:MAG: cobaltochelatase subunit CobN [Alphaproteobacteria bacterium]|nr:cobaltochelatase subunit CobN [Alphaproteobacteria bacterium]
MHLLATQPGLIDDGAQAVDLGQSPGDIVVLSAADSEIAGIAAAHSRSSAPPTLRLANLMQLNHNMSVDLYADDVIAQAKLVIVRVLGGHSYWPYGIEQITELCRRSGIALAWLPGDDQPDAELTALSTLPGEATHRLWQYCVHGGPANYDALLAYAATLCGQDIPWREPAPLLRAGLYWPGLEVTSIADLPWEKGQPSAAVVFYRALVQAANTTVIDALIESLARHGLNPLPLYASSLKDPVAAAIVQRLIDEAEPSVILNGTGFALSNPGEARGETPFDAADCPILQTVFSGGDVESWREGTRGLSARDIAMNVALPEVDGRILSRAVSFKDRARRDEAVEADIVAYQPVPDRIDFVAALAANWARLRSTTPQDRRVALVLANYPNRDGRMGNGVGLDTPAGAVNVLRALEKAGYRATDMPDDGASLIARLAAGPTNAGWRGRQIEETLSFIDYNLFFAALPEAVGSQVLDRWGPPETDPFFRPADLDCGSFAIPAFRFGNVAVALQPARGYNIDPVASYHDPALVPPHNYFAFHAWLREAFGAHAVVHMGKHGNLEWLPGKALALSSACFPEAALGPMPNLYPFIVNDPGEGTQAKRRTQAVIIDHLTPPLTRAESYGPLKDLEALVDEYFEAAGIDPHRLKVLGTQILELARDIGLDKDCGISPDADETDALGLLDNFLCELKEMQIRDGLHIFGESPDGARRTDLLVALARVPRRAGEGGDASLIRALAKDLGLEFDPLNCVLGEAWTGVKPEALNCPLTPDETSAKWSETSGSTPTLILPPQRGGDNSVDHPSISLPPRGGKVRKGVESMSVAVSQKDIPTGDGWGEGMNAPWRTNGDTVEKLELLAQTLVANQQDPNPNWTATHAVLAEIDERMAPALDASGAAEIDGILRGLDGRFVAPGPSGAPTRGRPDVLPTGRNFYSIDTRTAPTPAAWLLGWKSAQMLVERYAQDHGGWPKRLALSAWGTSNMRTGGDDISQALALIGARPTWDSASRRVTGFEVLPLDILDRPRVDVTLRISGFFRDAFPALIDLFDSAVRAVAALDEDARDNPLAERVRQDTNKLTGTGLDKSTAARRAGARVFGSKPGAYGAGLQALIDEKGWETSDDLSRAYLAWGGYAYCAGAEGEAAHGLFETRLRDVEAVVHNQDNREHDLLDSDDYYQFEGGMAATVHTLSGKRPAIYHNDHSRPETPKIRRLEEEIARTVRARVVNPKWIAGVMRHGYKGAFEMAATVDYMFAFAATTGAVADHHFDAVFNAYLDDSHICDFIAEHNPAALQEIAARLMEAQDRGLWQPRSNISYEKLEALRDGNRVGDVR